MEPCDDLDLAVSGKHSCPIMEEKTVLLQSTPGSEVIGNLSPSPLMAGKPERPLPLLGQKSFPELPPKGESEVGKRHAKAGSCQLQLS